ncbi:hypothetical protein Tco_0499591 [Tanacetum coccineum]
MIHEISTNKFDETFYEAWDSDSMIFLGDARNHGFSDGINSDYIYNSLNSNDPDSLTNSLRVIMVSALILDKKNQTPDPLRNGDRAKLCNLRAVVHLTKIGSSHHMTIVDISKNTCLKPPTE